jgi:hypothetical protein
MAMGCFERRLMQEIEAAAAWRSCRAAHLDTFSFQALEFYENLGYGRFGMLPDYPRENPGISYGKKPFDAAGIQR